MFLNMRKLLSLLFIVVILVACRSKDKSTQNSNTDSSDKPVIKLVVNPWVGAELNAEVARYLLEEELGYRVELVEYDGGNQWEALAQGKAHASLEVWSSGRVDAIQQYIEEDKTVVRGTDLGVIGKVGWYIPTYMIRVHPELAKWEGFLNPENTALFATDASEGHGQFLLGDPNWGTYDAQIAQNLGMDFQVVSPDPSDDSEAALLKMVDDAYQQQKPIIFYFWTPHWAYIVYDLTEVKLPPYSEACYAKLESGGIDCDYPSDVLFKVYWAGLEEYAPEAYQFLQNFHYTNQDQIAMLAMVQLEGKTPREAAITWVNEHEDTWQQWLP